MYKNHCLDCTWEELKGCKDELHIKCQDCGAPTFYEDVSYVFIEMFNWYIDEIDSKLE